MQWREVTISTTTQGADIMAQVLFDAGVAGVSIEDREDIVQYQRASDDWDYLDEALFASLGATVLVKGYLPVKDGTDALVQAIAQRTAEIASLSLEGLSVGGGEVVSRTVADEDWAENWKQYYKPFLVGETLAVTPCWETFEAQGRTVVQLEPGAAFGTGQHETTLMCLSLLEQAPPTGQQVLDIGCGTGILGIAAVCLGAAQALMIDRDEVAVSAAHHNASLNDCLSRVRIVKGNLADEVQGTYELIFANIVADAVIALLPDALPHLAQEGRLICSGIILAREQEVIAAASTLGLRVSKRLNQGEWVALELTRER